MIEHEDGTLSSRSDVNVQSNQANTLVRQLQALESLLLGRNAPTEAAPITDAINVITRLAFGITPEDNARKTIATALADRYIARCAARYPESKPYESLSVMPKSYSDDFYKDAEAVIVAMGGIVITPIPPKR